MRILIRAKAIACAIIDAMRAGWAMAGIEKEINQVLKDQHNPNPLLTEPIKIYHDPGLDIAQRLKLREAIDRGETVGVLAPGFKKVAVAKTHLGLERVLNRAYKQGRG